MFISFVFVRCGSLRINKMPPKDIPKWRSLANRLDNAERKVTIAVVGKYTGL
jgi:CTP synthase (UTP-ammonia lyase)